MGVKRAYIIQGYICILSQRVIGIINKLGFSKNSSINNGIGKQVIFYRITKDLSREKPLPTGIITTRVRMQFIAAALSVSNMSKLAPVSLEIALEIEFKKSVNYITAGLVIDPAATERECRGATAVVAIRTSVAIKRLVGTVKKQVNSLNLTPKS